MSSAESYSRLLKQLLPTGSVWNLEGDSVLSKVLLAIGDELARIHERARDLIEESDPRTATETLEDWERVLDLPDEDIEAIPATDAERRLAIVQKLIRIGGQTEAYYIQLAAACGYTVTIETHHGDILRAGFRAGARVGGLDLAYTWTLVVQAPAGAALSHSELEAVITRAAPTYTIVQFEYL